MRYAVAFTLALALGFSVALTACKADPNWELAKAAVLEKLATPSTAVFGEPIIENVKPGVYIVAGYVDAQNLYGAMVREKFNVAIIGGEVTECLFFSEEKSAFDN